MSYTPAHFAEHVAALLSSASSRFQRQLVVLSGERRWAYQLLSTLNLPDTLRFGDLSSDLSDYNRAWKRQFLQKQLGKEFQTIIFDAYQGFDPDLFCALTGTLRGGGICFLMTPELEQWPAYNDPDYQRLCVYPYVPEKVCRRFLARLARHILSDPRIAIVRQCRAAEASYDYRQACIETIAAPADAEAALHDQQAVVKQLRDCIELRNATAVLMADRGRGKSSALGMLAAAMMRDTQVTILLTAPQRDAVHSVFQRLGAILDCDVSENSIRYGESQLLFQTPDAVMADIDHYADTVYMLMVDEAAAIPNYLLQTMQEKFSRVIYSTTVHGYEGSGRGFALRFLNHLQQVRPDYESLQLTLPIRWAADDPLESYLDRCFCFKGDEVDVEFDVEQARFCELSRDQLAEDEALLNASFSLLVNAHYRTRPSDLRQLLDAPNIRVFALLNRHASQQQMSQQVEPEQIHVLGVMLVSLEGAFEASLAAAIAAGERRPQGHLLPQSLSVQCGVHNVLTMPAARIMRIAVAPQLQGKGLGSRLLSELKQIMQRDAVDYLGTSFGAYAPLVNFWQRSGYQAVSLGTRKDAASGEHAVLMVQALSARAEDVLQPVMERFPEDLAVTAAEFFAGLGDGLMAKLKAYGDIAERTSCGDDRRHVEEFVAGQRQYDYCFASLYRYLSQHLHLLDDHPGENRYRLLTLKILQHRPWAEVAQQLNLPGRRGVIQALRQSYAELLSITTGTH